VGTNLTGAKYALAVPTYTYEAGLKDFADIAKFHEQLNGKIHALEAGNDSNNVLIKMQEEKAFGFESFEIVESSEQGMLAAVEKAVSRNEPIVFVGWSPHPMNTRVNMSYLGGGDEYFGPNYGSAEVWTGLRPAFADKCPNALKFFQNLRFTPDMLSANMTKVLDDNKTGQEAALEALKNDDSVLADWLVGVKTFDGGDALAAVKSYIQDN
jgi:glycine betaine/proline transport system substrate-binding protein